MIEERTPVVLERNRIGATIDGGVTGKVIDTCRSEAFHETNARNRIWVEKGHSRLLVQTCGGLVLWHNGVEDGVKHRPANARTNE